LPFALRQMKRQFVVEIAIELLALGERVQLQQGFRQPTWHSVRS
jgi:hypothetical protein